MYSRKLLEHFTDECVQATVPSCIGELTVVGNDVGVMAVLWHRCRRLADIRNRLARMKTAPLQGPTGTAAEQLRQYFDGYRTEFDVPLAFIGTPFQKRVWRALQSIPYGTTASYQSIARKVGGPNMARAVGMANGKNPIPIIVPCHRVIGKNGTLTGFGGGLNVKRRLLQLESITLFA